MDALGEGKGNHAFPGNWDYKVCMRKPKEGGPKLMILLNKTEL
jgi:hypothetical protein